MSDNQIYITACGAYLPQKISINYAEIGIDQNELASLGYSSLSVENELYPVEMAEKALDDLFQDKDVNREDISFVCYTNIHRQGNNIFWSPASYIQNRYGLNNAIPFNLSQGCNSELLAIDLMRAQLCVSEDPDATVLILSADRFSITKFDRYASDYGIFYGDSASAVLIGKKPGLAKILNIHSVSAPQLEGLHRSSYCNETSETLSQFYDVRCAKRKFLEDNGKDFLMDITRDSLTALRKKIFQDHSINTVDYFIFPNVGSKLLFCLSRG
jgi:3-oxoacyl-[acyl-carrier-protein] synthase-3